MPSGKLAVQFENSLKQEIDLFVRHASRENTAGGCPSANRLRLFLRIRNLVRMIWTITTCGALATGLTGCGAGLIGLGVALSQREDGEDKKTVVATSVNLLTPDDRQSGTVRVEMILTADANHRIRIEDIAFSLVGDAEDGYRPATPVAAFPTEFEAGDEITEFPDRPRVFLWNARADIDALRDPGSGSQAVSRPTSARTVVRVILRNLSTGKEFVRVTDEFFLSLALVETVAGGGVGDGLFPREASLLTPRRIHHGANNEDLFVADTGNHRVRLVRVRSGVPESIETIAGNGYAGVVPGVSSALRTSLSSPMSVVPGADGTIYIAELVDEDGLIRVVDRSTGIILPLLDAPIKQPEDMDVDEEGFLYVADSRSTQVMKFDIRGIDPFFVGTDEINAETAVQLQDGSMPIAVSVVEHPGASQAIYLGDAQNRIVLRAIDGVPEVVAGGGPDSPQQGMLATEINLQAIAAVAADESSFFIAEATTGRMIVVDATSGFVLNVLSDFTNLGGVTVIPGETVYLVEAGNSAPVAGSPGHLIARILQPQATGAMVERLVGADALKNVSPALGAIQELATFQDAG
jgi:hypothetical protein